MKDVMIRCHPVETEEEWFLISDLIRRAGYRIVVVRHRDCLGLCNCCPCNHTYASPYIIHKRQSYLNPDEHSLRPWIYLIFHRRISRYPQCHLYRPPFEMKASFWPFQTCVFS